MNNFFRNLDLTLGTLAETFFCFIRQLLAILILNLQLSFQIFISKYPLKDLETDCQFFIFSTILTKIFICSYHHFMKGRIVFYTKNKRRKNMEEQSIMHSFNFVTSLQPYIFKVNTLKTVGLSAASWFHSQSVSSAVRRAYKV